MLVALVVFVSACSGGDGDDGDQVVAFCERLEQAGTIDTDGLTVDPAALDELVDLAPDEIRPATEQMRNTLSDIDDLESDDLAALFSLAFDPEARDARQDMLNYARTTCLIDVSTGEIAALRQFLDENFANQRWVDELALDVEIDEAGLVGVSAEFEGVPLGDDALDACDALGVYLYVEREGSGAVTVSRGGETLASRLGPEASCQRP